MNAEENISEGSLRRALRGAGLRVTSMRLAVLRALAGAPAALAATEIADAAAAGAQGSADRVTVYRTLAAFEKAGLVHKIDPGDRTFRYSLTDHSACRGDHHDHEHPHLVCDACGLVRCLRGAQVVVHARPGGARVPFRVRSEGVTLRGTCERCETRAVGRAARGR
ncbi:MAG: transcriptional repressor [Phycisphaeraceae bacterium]|nr:transcriptional repressor [Phycisphaeraceae bacterium]